MTKQETKKRIEALEYENAMLRQKIEDMRDVLRFCAMSGVGTYYQQQSAREMLLNNTKLVWDRNNEDGTYNESYKNWIFKCGGQEALDAVLAEEKELLGG
jgi:hypothetical protein